MKKFKLKADNINKFIDALEEMIDARDDMWEEEQHHNWRYKTQIEDERYNPAKEAMRQALYGFIVEVMEEE